MKKLLILTLYFVFSLITINSVNAQSTSIIGFDSVVIHKIACNQPDSTFWLRINVIYPIATSGNTKIKKFLNQFISSQVLNNLFDLDKYYGDPIPNVSNIDSAINMLIDSNIGNDSIPLDMYFGIDLKASVIFQDDNNITLFFYYNENMGGAHGIYFGYYYTLNKTDFKQVTISDVVTDTNKLNTIGEQLFKQQCNIPKEVSITDGQYKTPFNFSPSFYLSKNFGIERDTLWCHYNVYEIAGYTAGPSELAIPFTSISNILKGPFKHEVQNNK